jgi:hypothetical protein
METRVVYVTNYAGHDYLPAQKFGQLKYLTSGFVDFRKIDRLKFEIAEKLKESKPEDYLCLSGSAFVCVIAAMIWLERHGSLNLLNFDKKSDEYEETNINKRNIEEILNVIHS